MKLLFTGRYNVNYNRTVILCNGLRACGVEIIELPFVKWTPKIKGEIQNASSNVNFVFLPCFTHNDVRRVSKIVDKPVIFDPLISKYLTKVFDYKQVWKFSPRALKNFYKDKRALDAADYILADTIAHKNYFSDTFSIPPDKIKVTYIGYNDILFTDIVEQKREKFTVGFYGGFIPLQGVEVILEAASLLKNDCDIDFVLVGSGFQFEQAQKFIQTKLLTNVQLTGWVNQDELPHRIKSFDICLGIFGTSLKTDLVIPNKVYDYAGCAKPIITKNTSAIKELFTDDNNICLVDGSAPGLVEKIIELKNDSDKREKLGKNAFSLMNSYRPSTIGRDLLSHLTKLKV